MTNDTEHASAPVHPAETLKTEEELRHHIATAKRVVVKIGTSSLVNDDFSISQEQIDRIVDALQARMAAGSDVIVVSSGAIAAGMAPLGLSTRPRDLATKQASAAVGQVHLAQSWGRSFARYGRTIGQVLLTQSDAGRRDRARNAQRTIDKLRQLGTVPIVNENDTVATSEMRFGDNDRLSAIVSTLVSADALYLLSDVDGLYDRNPADPEARLITQVRSGKDLDNVAAGDGGALGTGGMAAKVSAARLAARGRVPVLLTSIGLSSYAFGLALAAIVVRVPDLRNVAMGVAYLTIMAVCGVTVPLDFWPEGVASVARALPVTHALSTVRTVVAGEPTGVLAGLGAELLVMLGWLVVAAMLFRWLVASGRANGSIEFSR